MKRTLVLLEISEVEDIQLDEQRLQAETERTLNVMTQYMSSSDKRKLSNEGMLANLAGTIAAEMAINQTLEFLRSMAKDELDEAEESKGSEEPEDQEMKGNEDQQVDPDTETQEDKEEETEHTEVELDEVDITDEEKHPGDEITEDAPLEDASTQDEDK